MGKKFIIVCQARTGSTLLTTALRQNPAIVENGEVFLRIYDYVLMFGLNWLEQGPQFPLAYKLAQVREQNYVSFLYEWAFYPGKAQVAGFKFKYEELSLPEYKDLVDIVAEDTSIAILHLVRDNLLERLLSQKRALDSWIFEIPHQHEPLETKSFYIEPQECLEEFRTSEHLQAYYRNLFKEHDILELRYEDLIGKFDNVMRYVQDFLGVKPIETQKMLRKIQRGTLRERLINYDEPKEFFKDMPYVRFFNQ